MVQKKDCCKMIHADSVQDVLRQIGIITEGVCLKWNIYD